MGVVTRQPIWMWIGERPSGQWLGLFAHASGVVAAGPRRSPAWRHYLRAVFRAGAFRAVVLRAVVLRAAVFRAGALAGAAAD